jgi:LPXTG-motif cell wall-anchored protein
MVFVNGNQCKEIEQGIFLYTVEDWSPIQNYAIEVYAPNFEKTTKTVSTLQTANTTLYILIGLVAGLIATLFVLKRKKE